MNALTLQKKKKQWLITAHFFMPLSYSLFPVLFLFLPYNILISTKMTVFLTV